MSPDPVLPADHPALALPALAGPAALPVGAPVALQFHKWDGSVHWRFPSTFLRTDDWGTWLGQAAGTPLQRPGRHLIQETPCVVLVPHERWWVATFHHADFPGGRSLYVDAATPATWHRGPESPEVHAVDLDLDVVLDHGASQPWVDDEDEFAEHAAAMSYPAAVIASAREAATQVRRDIGAGREPFAARGHGLLADWIDRSAP